MNYSTDKAITNAKEDLLGRAPFSKNLGRAIYDYKGTDSLVIGLYGKWGTGKTSVINMALQEIESLSIEDDNKPVIIRFAPWNYSDKDSLISLFFNCLKNTIDKDGIDNLKTKIGEALDDYSETLEIMSFVPVVGNWLKPLLKTAVREGGKKLAKPLDLDSSKQRLERCLLAAQQKIIVLIDDIDRLTNSQIRDIFQLVKQVGDLPYIVYILAMDRDIVQCALTKVHDCDGKEYLEKIIQIPFEISPIDKLKLQDIMNSKILDIITEISKDIVWDKLYYKIIWCNCIEPYIRNMRDVERVINTFAFRYGMLYKQTMFEDMIALAVIEVLEPQLYNWIMNNKELLYSGEMRTSNRLNISEYKKEFELLGIDAGKAIVYISTLFPDSFCNNKKKYYGIKNGKTVSMSDRNGNRRGISKKECFEVYFGLESNAISNDLIDGLIFKDSEEVIKKKIEEFNKNSRIIYVLKQIISRKNSIPYDRIKTIAYCLLEKRISLKGEESNKLYTVSARELATDCVKELVELLKTTSEIIEFYVEAIERSKDNKRLGEMAENIADLDAEIESLSIVDEIDPMYLEKLEYIKKEFLRVVKIRNTKEDILEIDNFYGIFGLVKSIDEDWTRSYVNGLQSDNRKKLKFICRSADKWYGVGIEGWTLKRFGNWDYSCYFSEEEIYNLIEQYGRSHLQEFGDDEQIILGSFKLEHDKKCQISEKEANELVNTWKEE